MGAVLLTAGVVALIRAQDQEPTITFRSSIEAVEIDVYVTDEEGNPVSGLTVDDFELFEDGVPQPITTFTAVDIPIEGSETEERALAESDVRANNGPEGRAYVFALDEVLHENILHTRRYLRQFIEQHFEHHDLGAVVLLGRGLATSGADFTNDRGLLLEAVDRFSGGFAAEDVALPTTPPPAIQPEPCRGGKGDRLPGNIRTTGLSQQMASLRSLMDVMARMPGRHKALLFFTECIAVDVTDVIDYNGGVLSEAGEDAHAAMAAATGSNVAIYPIDPTGLSADVAIPLQTIDAFRAIAEATGGSALINSNSFAGTFERIVRDNSTYYMLGFNSAYDRDDGKYVRLEVRVNKPGLVVRTRAGYVAPTRDERRARQRAREREEPAASPALTAIASPLTTDGLPMRVFAAPFRREGDEARVALALELDAATLGLTFDDGAYTGEVDVAYVATDARRRVYPERRHTASIRIDTSSRTPPPLDGLRVRVLTELELEDGRYQLRVGAASPTQTGSVVYDMEVPDFSDGDLTMSGLAFVQPAERHVLTLQADRRGRAQRVRCDNPQCRTPPGSIPARSTPFAPMEISAYLDGRLSGPPTTVREFARGDEIVLVAEVYDNRPTRRNESPRTIELTVSLHGRDGATIPLAAATRPAAGGNRSAQLFAIRLPLQAVAPGRYALQAAASASDRPAVRVSREVEIAVK